MNAYELTCRDVSRAYDLRLRRSEERARGTDLRNRLRLRRQLHRAIENVVRIEGRSPQLARELVGLVQRSEARLNRRACC